MLSFACHYIEGTCGIRSIPFLCSAKVTYGFVFLESFEFFFLSFLLFSGCMIKVTCLRNSNGEEELASTPAAGV